MHPHVTHASFVPRTASRSVQPFLHSSWQSVMPGHVLSPKIAPSHEAIWTPSNKLTWPFGPTQVHTQAATRSVQPSLQGSRSWQTDIQTDILISRLIFAARLRPQFRTPPVPNAPSWNALELRSLHAPRRRFKIYLLRQFCSNRVNFLQCTWGTDATNDGPEFWNSNSVIFEIFFEILKKASRGPSVADLDYYGRQTRSE